MRLVISPHLDDAVFSCHSVLERGTRVVTVFSGIPHEAAAGGHWDRVVGNDDPHGLVKARRAEDETVLRELGCSWRHLDFLEDQYRDDGDLVLADVRAALLDEARRADELWFPVGCASHVDHAVTAALCFSFFEEIVDGTRCFAYADYPYWLITEQRQGAERKDADLETWFDWAVVRNMPRLEGRHQFVARQLDPAQRARREASMRGYDTQFDAVNATAGDAMATPENLGREYYWNFVPKDAVRCASDDQAGLRLDEGSRR
ncbi:PIG-L family deacetylase [Oerskovia turbata]